MKKTKKVPKTPKERVAQWPKWKKAMSDAWLAGIKKDAQVLARYLSLEQ